MEDLSILSPGQRLKRIRKILKLKQDELAGDRFSKNYISMFENNKRNINAINATYLANQINEFARIKGKDININATYFLKSDIDVASEKCEKWLKETEHNLKHSDNECNLNLYKVIHVSNKFGLSAYRAKALYLKGVLALQNKRYQCAMAQLLGALVFYAKENDFLYISDIYEKIGLIFYYKREINEAIVYFNLSYDIMRNSRIQDRKRLEDLNYYMALCYYEKEKYLMAKKMIGMVETKSIRISELTNRINRALAV